MPDTFDEMKAYVRFDAGDAERLARTWPVLAPHAEAVSEAFYDRILQFDGARAVFRDEAQTVRLRATLQVWLRELVLGPHDTAYAERRRRIGDIHVRIGLEHRYMFTAMVHLQEQVCAILRDALPDADQAMACAALRKVAMLDLALMTGTYLGARVRGRVEDLATVLIAHLPTAAMLLDAEHRVVVATDAARRLCAVDPVGRPMDDALDPALVEAADLRLRLRETDASRASIELPRVDATVEGRPRSFRVVCTPLDHDQFASLVVLEELTDTIAQEAEQRRMEALVQLGGMSAAVAHELRNPLAGISGAMQVMADAFPPEDRRSAIMGKVHDQVRRLDRMVHDLLAFSRPPRARLQRIAMHDVVDGVIELVAGEDGVEVVRVGAGYALADPDLLHRIVLNLVQNAVSAVDGRGRVEVRVADQDLVVADDGPGIDDAVRDGLFEPFVTTRTSGTGLGLAICRNAAAAMDAELTLLDDRPLGGAAFRLRLREPRAHAR